MKNNLDRRFPIHEIRVVAIILDPAQRNLHLISEFLNEHNMTAVNLLSKFVDRYVGDRSVIDDVQEMTPQHAEPTIPQSKKVKLDLLQ